MNKRVSITTLGCKVNQYESESIVEGLREAGYTVVDDFDADYYIINTCTVTGISDKKSRQFIRRARKHNEDAVIAVIGCYPQANPEDVMSLEEVNIVLGNNEKKNVIHYLDRADKYSKIFKLDKTLNLKVYDEMKVEDTLDKTRVFLKIQDGCNQYCSYCIIPYARGPIRSRKPVNIIKEVSKLTKKGYKEFVLTGIHLSSYGKDIDYSLIDIIEEIAEVEGVKRIRLGSLEPGIITEDFVKRLKNIPSFCNHFHLSLQSGSDTVLKRMNRRYTAKEYLDAVHLIKKELKDPSFTTDIIVGFPEETDLEFKETCDFVKKVSFSKVHIFKYSPRKNTKAAQMRDLNGTIKNTRSKKLEEICLYDEELNHHKFIGKKLSVLFEDFNNGYLEGFSKEYLRVSIKGRKEDINTIKDVFITSYKNGVLMGEISG